MNSEFMYDWSLWEFTGKSTISLISHCLTGLKRLPDQYKLNQVHYISKCTSLILYNKHFISTERKVHVHINVYCYWYIQSNLNVSDVDPQVILIKKLLSSWHAIHVLVLNILNCTTDQTKGTASKLTNDYPR